MPRPLVPSLCALSLLLASGCEIAASFDREKIPPPRAQVPDEIPSGDGDGDEPTPPDMMDGGMDGSVGDGGLDASAGDGGLDAGGEGGTPSDGGASDAAVDAAADASTDAAAGDGGSSDAG